MAKKKKQPSPQELADSAGAYAEYIKGGGSGQGYWTAIDDKNWKYTDQYGNSTTDVKNADGSYKYGSTWDSSAGKWVGTDSLTDTKSAYEEAIRNQQFYQGIADQQAYNDRRQSAIEEAYAAQRRAELERQQAQIGQINNLRPEYDKQAEMTAQQAYINKMLAEKGLNEKLAANGLSGTGVSESAKISNENNYGNSLNQTLQARDEAYRGLDNQIQAVQSGGAANLSSIEAAYQQQVLNALEQQKQQEWQMKQYYDQMAQQQWQNNFNQQQFDTANNQWNQQFDYQKQQDSLAAQQALQAAAARTYSGGSSGSKSGSSMKISDAEKIIKANQENGTLPPQEALDIYSNYYGFSPTLYNEDSVKQAQSYVRQAINQAKQQGLQWDNQQIAEYIKAYQAARGLSDNDAIELMKRLGI